MIVANIVLGLLHPFNLIILMNIVKGLLGLSQSRPWKQTKTGARVSYLKTVNHWLHSLRQSCDGLIVVPGVAAIALTMQLTGARSSF